MTKLNTAGAVYLGMHKADKVCLGANVVWPLSFPATPILDNFNRANENPIDPTHWLSGWNGDHIPAGQAFKIVSNKIVTNGVGNQTSALWKTPYAGDSEVYVDLSTLGPGEYNSISAAVDDAAGNQYQFQIAQGSGWFLTCYAPGYHSLFNGTDQFQNGDSAGMRVSNGVISVWRKPAGGSWYQLASVNDSSLTGGSIGIESDSRGQSIFDNFGGGAI